MCELSGQWLQFLAWLCIAPVICAAGLCVTAARGSLPTLMSSTRGRACARGGGTVLQPCCCFGNQFVDCAQVQLAQAAVPAWLPLAAGACPSAAWLAPELSGGRGRLAAQAAAKENGHLDLHWGEAPAWWGQYRWATLTAHSPSWEHSSCESSQLMWWECILRAKGLSFLMCQRAGQSQGLAAANHASQPVGEVGAEAFRCRVPAGGVGEMYPSLRCSSRGWQGWVSHPCDWGGGCTPTAWSEPAPAPRLGSSVCLPPHLPPCCCREVQQNKNLNSYKIY